MLEDRVSLCERLLHVPDDVPRIVWYGRLAAFGAMGVWGVSILLGRMTALWRCIAATTTSALPCARPGWH